MHQRNILLELQKWKQSSNRKPLLLRGARQVGKTTVVNEFAKGFKHYIKLNLERKEEAKVFENFETFSGLVDNLFFLKNINRTETDVLVFIDEIQEVPEAINLLRYFYEDYPELHVIAVGSLLETILSENVTIPVGRLEYRVLRPMSFEEFLMALGEKSAIEQYRQIPIDVFAHAKMMSLFKTYMLIGGMPEIIKNYVENRDLKALNPIYESLIMAYNNDVEKYARNSSMVQVIWHVIESMSSESGTRIKFEKFGKSNYGSREIGEAMRTLEKAFIMHLIYPTVSTQLPILKDRKKSPRLQVLDTGLLNRQAGIQKEILLENDLEAIYQGKIIEHVVGQELLASKFNVLNELLFWTREKKDATAEIDFVYAFDGKLIPIEVKSGSAGRLRSLHYFMEKSTHPYAVRLYGDKLNIDELELPSGKKYHLLNLPYYLTGQIENF